MKGRFALLSIALFSSMGSVARGQDLNDNWQVSLVKSAGPYEIKGESGVIGFVVASSGDMVRFKPCTGDSMMLNRKQLVSTKNDCANSPSPNENPFVANCNSAVKRWDVRLLSDALHDDGPIGKTYTKKPGEMVMAAMIADPKQVAATVDAADQLKDCGPAYGVVGFDRDGVAKVSLIPSAQAIQLDESK